MNVNIFIAYDELRTAPKDCEYSTHWGWYVVDFYNVVISALFNCVRVVWNMFGLELC
jgi:ribosomal silencing factor RsfS